MRFLFKYPSRSRPEVFKKTLNTWYKLLSGRHECHFVCSFDEDDVTMNNPEMRAWLENRAAIDEHQRPIAGLCPRTNFHYVFGRSASKIEAVNADMEVVPEWDILVLISDDMIPEAVGYDDIIARDMATNYPNLDGGLNYYDGLYSNVKCATLSIMGRRLYDQFKYIYHPSYKSFFCDNEYTAVANPVFINKVIIRHEWQALSGDELARKNTLDWQADKANYETRKSRGFPLYTIDKGSALNICIVNFSKGGWYPDGQRRLVRTFREQGFRGDFILATHEKQLDCPSHQEVPYAFKSYMIQIARKLRYRFIIWVDAAIIPVKPFERLLAEIQRDGYIFFNNGWNTGQWCSDAALVTLGLTREEAFTYPHMMACCMGLDMTRPECNAFADQYYQRALDGTFCGAWTNGNGEVSSDDRVLGHRHDQTAASVIAHRLGMRFRDGILTYNQDPSQHGPEVLLMSKGGV